MNRQLQGYTSARFLILTESRSSIVSDYTSVTLVCFIIYSYQKMWYPSLCYIFLGRPVVYRHSHEYSSGSANSILSLECPSRNSIPSNVMWLRNNEIVDTLNGLYETVKISQSLSSSYFRNILIVRSVAGALGNQRYTCHIQNTFGDDSANIILQREGRPCYLRNSAIL